MKKDRRNKKYRSPKSEKPQIPMPTYNAKMIHDLMVERKIKGKYKDYVIIMASKLIDWLNTYEIAITLKTGEMKRCGVNGIALLHKSKLKNVLDEETAKKFWSHGMRTNMNVESRRCKCIVNDKKIKK
jgi:hypothetical protein